ncbi:MAG TPA: 4Fe-4S binding protein [Syntrophorhabdales bacterium]|nr:4Fe-4S binding protein [Syntrophorhabdales bacterium]
MARECEKRVAKKVKQRTIPPRKRKADFSPVEMGLTEEEAIQEARRCLGSQSCESCDVCSLLCPDLCITRDEASGNVLIDLDYCKGCGICAAVCPKGAIKMKMEE